MEIRLSPRVRRPIVFAGCLRHGFYLRIMETVAFIGAGVMGAAMAGHLLAAGHVLRVYTRTRKKAEGLLANGAVWADSPREAAAGADAAITMVGYPKDVETVYFGGEGIFAGAAEGVLLIDMTTSLPGLARRIAATAAERGMRALDAPVSGGDVGAREARLSIMVGGDEAAFQRALPLFRLLGKTITRQGGSGTGQLAKAANQLAVAANTLGACEALAFAVENGLDGRKVLEATGGGAAGSWSLNNLGPRMLEGDFAPGFYVKHMIKDLEIARESAREAGMELPGLELALARYRALAERFGGEDGTQGLFRLYR